MRVTIELSNTEKGAPVSQIVVDDEILIMEGYYVSRSYLRELRRAIDVVLTSAEDGE